jgi:hypothetical protein
MSPYPINSDIQPFSGILAILVVFQALFISKEKINKNLILLFMFSFFLLGWNNPLSSNFNPDYGKMFSITFGILIMMAFYISKEKIDHHILNVVISIYFIYSILILIAPSLFINIQNIFIRNTNSSDDFSYRGISTLSTEPGLFGGLLIFFLLIIDNLYENSLIGKKNINLLRILIFLMILMTKSGSGYLYFLIYLSFKLFSKKKNISHNIYYLLFLSFSALIIVYSSFFDMAQYGRGFDIISRVANPETFLDDSSVFSRIVSLSIGFYSIIIFPFGTGNGSVNGAVQEIVANNQFLYSFFMGKEIGFNSSFSYLMVSNGLIFLIFFILGYFYFSKTKVVNKFFSAVFLIISFSAAFPAIWILLILENEK